MAISRLDLSEVYNNSRMYYVPFDDGSGSSTARVVTSLNGVNASIIQDDKLTIGSTGFGDPFAVESSYFTPLNAAGENGDNFVYFNRNTTALLDTQWMIDLIRLDTLQGVGHLVMGGRMFYKGDGGSATQGLISCNDGDGVAGFGGLAAQFNGANKISGFVKETAQKAFAQLGTFTTMMANNASDLGVPGLNGVSEYEFSYLVHWDMVTLQVLIYINSWPTLGYTYGFNEFPSCDQLRSGICIGAKSNNSGIPVELFNDGTGPIASTRNSLAQNFIIRVEQESSSWVQALAIDHKKTFDLQKVLGF